MSDSLKQHAESVRIELGLIANELEQMSGVYNEKWPADLAVRLRAALLLIDGLEAGK
jgi:hypothetical protein